MSTCITKMEDWAARGRCPYDWQHGATPLCRQPTTNGTVLSRLSLDLGALVVDRTPCVTTAFMARWGALFYPERFAWTNPPGCCSWSLFVSLRSGEGASYGLL